MTFGIIIKMNSEKMIFINDNFKKVLNEKEMSTNIEF